MSTATTITLKILHNSLLRGQKTLTQDVIKIGKLPNSDICLEDAAVSHMHAVIEQYGGEARIIDLGSSVGTFLNGKRIEKNALLHDGDEICVGPYLLSVRFEAPQQVTPAALAPAPEADSQERSVYYTPLVSKIHANIVDVRHGFLIQLSDGGGMRSTTEGIDTNTGKFVYANSYAHKGAAVFYLAKGDGSATVLRPIKDIVCDEAGNMFEPMERLPLDSVSMTDILRKQRADMRAKMIAAGFTDEDINTAATPVD